VRTVRSFTELPPAEQRSLKLSAVWQDERLQCWASFRRALGSDAVVRVGPLNPSQFDALRMRLDMSRQIVSA